MSDQPQPTSSPVPKWLPTGLIVIGGLSILTFVFLTVSMKTLDWPGPVSWKMLMYGLACLAIGLWLRSKCKAGH